MGISSRLPGRGQIARVYAIAVLFIYGWTMMWFFWKLPGWLNFLNAGEILTVLAYALGANLLESLAALCFPIGMALALPWGWFREVFVARGAALMLTGLGFLMVAANEFKNRDELPGLLRVAWSPVLSLVGVVIIVYLAGRIGILRRALELLADRATIFLYVSVPLSVLAALVVAARWLR